jgi:hypothetical protein
MVLLWCFIAAAAVCMALAGGQAVRLLADRDGDIVRFSQQLTALQGEQARTQQQVEAQRILLFQAEQWIKAKKDPHVGQTTTP